MSTKKTQEIINKELLARLFKHGVSIENLAWCYQTTMPVIEDALREYMNRKTDKE